MAKDFLIGIMKSVLNLTFIFGGVVSLIISALCFFKPSLLKRLGTTGQKILINFEDIMMKNSKLWGIICLALAILLFYFGITIISSI